MPRSWREPARTWWAARPVSRAAASGSRQLLRQGPPPGADEERVGALVVRPLRQLRRVQRRVEFLVQAQPPALNFFPRQLATPDREQTIAVRVHLHGHRSIAEHADAGEQQPDQVHDVLPFHLALVAKVAL